MKKILIISGVAWNDTFQRHQNFANQLSKHNKVYFLESVPSAKFTFSKLCVKITSLFKKKLCHPKTVNNFNNDNIKILKYLFINPEFVFINNFLYKRIDSYKDFDVIYSFLPVPILDLIVQSQINRPIIIYDCVRNFEGWGEYSKSLLNYERKLLKMADQILVDSFFLKDKFKEYLPQQILPTVDNSLYDRYLKCGLKNEKISKIAYFGTIDKHIDLECIALLLREGYEIHIFGKINISMLKHDHLIYHGFYSDLQSMFDEIINIANAVIIPYKGNMDGVIPAKIMQSLLLPMPVYISSFFDSLCISECVYVYDNYKCLLNLLHAYNVEDFQTKHKKSLSLVSENLNSDLELKLNNIIYGTLQ